MTFKLLKIAKNKKDISRVAELEAVSFRFPLSNVDVQNYLTKKNFQGYKIEDKKKNLLAYIIFCTISNSVRIERLSVQTEHRRQGMGTYIVESLKSKTDYIEVLINEYNLDGQLFFKANDFTTKTKDILRKYWDYDHKEDAYKMIWRKNEESI